MKILDLSLKTGSTSGMDVQLEKFSRMIEDAAVKAGLDNKLAEFLGVSPNSIANWKNRKTLPQWNKIKEVCEKLNVDFQEFRRTRSEPTLSFSSASWISKAQEELPGFTRVPYYDGGRIKGHLAFQTSWLAGTSAPDKAPDKS